MKLRVLNQDHFMAVEKEARLLHLQDDPHFQFFLYASQGGEFSLEKSASDTLKNLGHDVEASRILLDTPSGMKVLDRSRLTSIAKKAVKASFNLPVDLDWSIKTAQKMDYPATFKEALKFLDSEMKKAQKEMGEDTPPEQIFSVAYEKLQESMPEFCAVWDKFTLVKGLAGKGWRIRAGKGRLSRSPFHDKALDLQRRIGYSVGNSEFQELSEDMRGVFTLHYGSGPSQEFKVHFWYAPWGPIAGDAGYEISLEKEGQVVASFREDNQALMEDTFDKAAKEVLRRWGGRVAANQISPDEADTSIPKSLGPDRSGWTQVAHQVFLALRDYLRKEVTFFPIAMKLLWEGWNGDAFEFTLKGDKENVSVSVQGKMELGKVPVLYVEQDYQKNGRGWTSSTPYPLSNFDTVTELVAEIQRHLEADLAKGLKRLGDTPSTIHNVLQRALTKDFV